MWHDNDTNTEVLALFHALGYGGAWPSRRLELSPDSHTSRRTELISRHDRDRDALHARAASVYKRHHSDNKSHDEGNADDFFFVDTNGVLVMRDTAHPFDDGPGVHVGLDGKVRNADRRDEACVPVRENSSNFH